MTKSIFSPPIQSENPCVALAAFHLDAELVERTFYACPRGGFEVFRPLCSLSEPRGCSNPSGQVIFLTGSGSILVGQFINGVSCNREGRRHQKPAR